MVFEDVYNVLNLKARLIRKDEVADLKPEIEEFYNEEEGQEYYYFPISGLKVGDELGYDVTKTLYLWEQLWGCPPDIFFGSRS